MSNPPDDEPTRQELRPDASGEAPESADERTLASVPAPPARDRPSLPVPRQIGPYRIVEEIGRGGMGRVYLAEQTEPVRRRVAIKLIVGTAASEEIVRRFESERQALALMNHPNIAQIYDAGTTDEGIPYFVMEYVAGDRITRYVSERSPDLEQRLRLFLQVCEALQHAHRKGVLHRDIKPSNVLVAERDGQPIPKVIDFGLAKAIGFALTDDPLQTRLGLVVGTPAYMSPEQVSMSGAGLDTRSDVYALGVLLYELLVGAPPFDPQTLSSSPLDEMVRIIRHEPPTRPSRRVDALLEAESDGHRGELEAIRHALVADLDWVILKALEKEPDRRYGSAEALGADVSRFLAHEPVEARRPTLLYRARKYLRRHAFLVSGTAAALLAVSLTFAWGYQRSQAEATRANQQALQASRQAIRAHREAVSTQQVADFLVGLFQESDPAEARGETVTARELLDRGAERIETELADQPLVQARLLDTMGTVYIQLGLYDRAEEMLRRALSLREARLGDNDLEVANTLDSLAHVPFLQGRYEETVPLLERSLAIRRRQLGPDDPLVAGSLNNLAAQYRELRRFDRAEELYRQALAILEAQEDPGAEGIAFPLSNLATVLHDQERFAEAEPLHLRALEIRREEYGENHPQVAMSLNHTGWFYYLKGDAARAEELYRRSLAIKRRIYDPAHPEIALTLNNLGLLYLQQGRLDEAEEHFQQALEIRRARLRPGHRNIAESLRGLGLVAKARGDGEQARDHLQRALAMFEQVRGPDHPDTVETRQALAALPHAGPPPGPAAAP